VGTAQFTEDSSGESLMILTRLASVLREQNWLSVVVEIFVVVGIVLAPQVDNWNN